MRLDLPWPISLNSAYVAGTNRRTGRKGRYLTKEARAYKALVQQLCLPVLARYDCPFRGGLEVSVAYYPPHNRRWDMSNFNKLLFDCFTEVGIYRDDSQIEELHQFKREKAIPGRVQIRIVEL